ncbi:type I-E CRISPR-associated protein Cse2/CasB [Paucibacter sp. XJ19-41]|uniref:type I-E CRISPR-associated protein Cse2/CasB n=1 Tax=Paucibacter sp. XJ19-41 TaxID=2927824 RepID=UPI00234BB192|nr:type I-E CRISPR-associated protein Cse2/CasB [Paucibacter sp. XJ19-41]MDC6166472.1 type I-E CRISPR-associated protein Cse2/CasB [Paucibacter sp. XJ19-41]
MSEQNTAATAAKAGPDAPAEPAQPGEMFSKLAGWIAHAPPGDRAALARLQTQALQPHELAALARGLLHAGLEPHTWHAETWPRWALIAQGMALTGHSPGRLGEQLADAGVSEARVTKLLTARGDAFRQLLPRVLRLLASKGAAPNWRELGSLVLIENDPAQVQAAEALRLRIAGPYFSKLARIAAA